MKLELQRDLARQTLDLLDRKTTVMAAHTLYEPVDRYTSEELFEKERRLIFGEYPLFVGLSCDLPGPGSWKTFNCPGTPLLITRDRDGRLRAMLNICQHRAMQVVPPGCGDGARRFTCPYHGWTYDIDGRLSGIPGPEGFADVDRGQRNLIELPTEERYGMMFVATNPKATFDLEQFFCGLGEQLALFSFETWKSIVDVHEHRVQANWKMVWDSHCEGYHFANLHQYSVGDMLINNTSIPMFFGNHALMTITLKNINALRDQPEDQWRPVEGGHLNLNYRLFPSLSMSVVFGDRLEIYELWPGNSVGETVSLHYAYRKEIPESAEARKQLDESVRYGCQTIVDAEDYRTAEAQYRSLRAPFGPKTVLIGRNEPIVQHMHRASRRAVGLPEV
jgi:choline monooxygenase